MAGLSYQGATGWDFAVARLNDDGSLDTSFDADGKQTIDFGSGSDSTATTWRCRPTARSSWPAMPIQISPSRD